MYKLVPQRNKVDENRRGVPSGDRWKDWVALGGRNPERPVNDVVNTIQVPVHHPSLGAQRLVYVRSREIFMFE